MALKCCWCDDKRQKEDKANGIDIKENVKNYRSIDEEFDSYVKDNNQYFHDECYRKKLKSKKKQALSDDMIEDRIKLLKVAMNDDRLYKISRDKFYEWIKCRYEENLPSYFVLRVDSISKGEDNKKQVYGSINFNEFLEMYQKLENYLNKVTYSINFNSVAQRMNYELAVVLGQYENYKKFKHESEGRQDTIKQVEKKIDDSKQFKEVANKIRNSEEEDFHISDIIDDMF